MLDAYDRYHRLDFESAVAARYHNNRRRFCERMARMGTAASLVFGGSAFAALFGGPEWLGFAKGAAFLVAAVSAVNLAFGTTEASRKQGDLFQKWIALRSEIGKADPDDLEAVQKLEEARAKIDADTPAQLDALRVLAENEEKSYRGTGDLYKVDGVTRCLANFGTMPWWRLEYDRPAGPVRQPEAVVPAE